MQIVIKEALFRCTFCPPSIFVLEKILFVPKIGHRNKRNYKMGAWWQNLRLIHDSTLFSLIFDTYAEYRSPNLVLVLKMWENLESNLPVCMGVKLAKHILIMPYLKYAKDILIILFFSQKCTYKKGVNFIEVAQSIIDNDVNYKHHSTLCLYLPHFECIRNDFTTH
jgi:hypothetical protein